LIISLSFLLRMKNVSDKRNRENQFTHFMFNEFFFENHAVYEMMRKNTVEPDRPQMTIWRMRIAYWIPKATNTHSEYAILTAFRLKKWLYEGVSMLRFTYVACIVCIIVTSATRAQERFVFQTFQLQFSYVLSSPMHVKCFNLSHIMFL
jgi:hypothetical protein